MFQRLCDVLARVAGVLSMVCLAAMTLAILINVFFRYVLNSPLAWPPELSRFLMVAVTLLAAGLALRKGAHVGVTVLVTRLPIRAQAVVFSINSLLMAGFLAVLLWQGFILAFFEGPRQTAPSLGISMMFAFIPLPLGAALMLVHLAETTREAWRRARVGRSPFEVPAAEDADLADQDAPLPPDRTPV
jgi:TRAP-type C4-dicarboxylate transport system permease small subunit